MLYAFVDESERGVTHYFLGAIVGTGEQIDDLTQRLDAVLAKHAASFPILTPDTEFHGSSMMRAEEEPWRSIPLRARIAIYKDAMSAIEATGIRTYVEGVDIVSQVARGYPHVTPARELAFSHLFERINDCCDWEQPQIQIVADEHHTSEVSRSNFSKYRNVGTYGYRSSYLPNISPDIEFIQSHTSRALQAADMITYIFNRVRTVTESDERAAAAKQDLWARVEASARWPRGGARIWP